MIKAGLIRQVASGIYNWLPLGLRVLKNVENIVRKEMEISGAQEILMPMVQPRDLWHETGRWQQYGKELLTDQHLHLKCSHQHFKTQAKSPTLRLYDNSKRRENERTLNV